MSLWQRLYTILSEIMNTCLFHVVGPEILMELIIINYFKWGLRILQTMISIMRGLNSLDN